MRIIFQFLGEFFNRIRAKSPTFFVVLQWIGIAATLVSGLPAFFEEINVILPEWASIAQSKLIGIAGLVTLILSKLPVETPPIITPAVEGEAKAVIAKLPFTDRVDNKIASE